MSKQVRWQVPFASRLGTAYRVDIYDEGYNGTPVQLTAGPTPFVTDEDSSDDFFQPVRSQSGTLQVCTHDEDGNVLITLDDILPANNISRPVRLVNVGTGAIEWQGFLSCEAYDQDYTGIPQNLDLSVISVLEAMASVEVDPAKISGLNTVGTTIQKLLEIFIDKAGVSYFSEYYVPTVASGRNILSKYIDATVLFEQKEYNNENSTTYIVSGLSLQDCLERIATYMGWCLRENSGTLYFMAANETVSYNRRYRIGMVDQQGNISYSWMIDFKETSVVSRDIASLLWAGVDHRRTVSQGAKSVEVVAGLKKYELRLSLPEFPYVNMDTYSITMDGMSEPYGSLIYDGVTLQSIISENTTFYNHCTIRLKELNSSTGAFLRDATVTQVLSWALINPNRETDMNPYETAKYVGAFYAKIKKNEDDYLDGLYIVGNHYWQSIYTPEDDTSHIFSIQRLRRFVCSSGKLILKTKVAHLTIGDAYAYYDGDYCSMSVCIKFGDKYWDGDGWSPNFARFTISNLQGKNGYEIPCDSFMQGDIEIRLYKNSDFSGILTPDIQYSGKDKFVSELSLEYQLDEDAILSDRSENHYFSLLGTNFRDEISIGTDLASMLNNHPSPSLIMNSETEAMTELNYGTTQAPDMRRPEVYLLNRLADYYGAARQRIELEVEHPTAAPLPLLKLNGINDGKVYLPLSESRDWKKDVCKLICFEMAQ